MDAEAAHAAGLIGELTAEDDVLTRATEVARALAQGPTLAIAATKSILADIDLEALRRTLRAEAETSAQLRSSIDHGEGVAALREKRQPRFTGR